MGARQKNPKIFHRLRRVRLFPEDLAAICEHMSFSGPPKLIEVDAWTCDSPEDIASVKQSTARRFSLFDSDLNLRLRVTDDATYLVSVGEPTGDAYLAERNLLALLKPKQKMRIENVRNNALMLLWAFVSSILLGTIAATTGIEPNDFEWTIRSAVSGLVVGGLAYLAAAAAISRIPPSPPVILDKDAWNSRSPLKRYGTEIGIATTMLSIVVAIVIAVVD